MLIALTSGKASPGATTTALALSFLWPRDVLVVDADPAGGDVVPGLLPGRVIADRGVLTWATATRRCNAYEAVACLPEHVVSLPEAPHVWVMPGVQNSAQGASVAASWPRLAAALERFPSDADRDVLVDIGRLGDASAWPVMKAADAILLVTASTARSVTAAGAAAATLAARLGDLDACRLVVVDRGEYEPRDIAGRLGMELLGSVADDRRTAATFVDGAAINIFGLGRSRLLKSLHGVPDRIIAALEEKEATHA